MQAYSFSTSWRLVVEVISSILQIVVTPLTACSVKRLHRSAEIILRLRDQRKIYAAAGVRGQDRRVTKNQLPSRFIGI